MSRYLSFLRKKVHGGTDDSAGSRGLDKKRKNAQRPVSLQEPDTILDRQAPVMVAQYSDSDSLLDSGGSSYVESDGSPSSVARMEACPLANRSPTEEADEGLDDEPTTDNDAIDDVIEKAFSDLEIGLLTELRGEVGGVLSVNEVNASVSLDADEESVVIITETTEEEIVLVNGQPVHGIDASTRPCAESSRGSESDKDVSRNEYTIKILVPSEKESSHNNNTRDMHDGNRLIKVGLGDSVCEIKTSKSFHTFPTKHSSRPPLRHSKSDQAMDNGVFCPDQLKAAKNVHRLSATGTSSEDDFDSAKETLSDDDLVNVTRIYIQQPNGTAAKGADQIDCAGVVDPTVNSESQSTYLQEYASPPSAKISKENEPRCQQADADPLYENLLDVKHFPGSSAVAEESLNFNDSKMSDESSARQVEEYPNTVGERLKLNQVDESFIIHRDESADLHKLEGTNVKMVGVQLGETISDQISLETITEHPLTVERNEELVEDNVSLNSSSRKASESETDERTSPSDELRDKYPHDDVYANSPVKSASHPSQHSTSSSHLASSNPNEAMLATFSMGMSTDRNSLNNNSKLVNKNKSVGVEQDILRENLVTSVSMHYDEAEARLAQRRAARVEAREMRLKDLEKHQPEEDEDNDEEKQYVDSDTAAIDKRMKKNSQRLPSSPNTKTPSRPSRSSVGRSSLASNSLSQVSRRSSEDSIPDDALPAFAKELKSELKEMEEKFRKAMITNAQLDNEKATLTYEVEFVKDKFTELEELHIQLTKEHRRKCTENEQLRKLSNKLKEEMKMLRKILQEREELIQEYGLVVVGEEENGEGSEYEEDEMMDDTMNNLSPRKIAIKKALLTQEAADLLSRGAASGSLDVRLKRYAEDKNELEDEVRRLKMELEEEVHRRRKENGLDSEKQKETSTYINEYKLRIQKSEAEVSTLQANVARLESLVTRYKAQSEELEKSEDELKTEKRKLLREFREAQTRLEETEIINSHLQKRFDKLKTARSTLLKDLSLDPPI